MPNIENIEPHKFKSGESGNPNGRPKGSRNLSSILKQMLTTEVEMDGERVQFQDAIIKKLLQKAQKGDIRAIQEIFDRVEGKPKQEVDQVTTIEDKRIDVSKLTDDELRLLADIQRKSGIS